MLETTTLRDLPPEEAKQICATVDAFVRFNKIRNLTPAVLRGVCIQYRDRDQFDQEFFRKVESLVNTMDFYGRIRIE